MEAYEQVQKGPLKLKGVAELGVTKRKKKKKAKDKAKLLEAMGTSKKNEEEKRRGLDKRTPAQVAFEKMQEKRDFNRHLDTLTEHYDIPKVSWTK
uniref:Protein FAM32A n=1 Tax=Prolemur simus TaxID=1328070 RepID=A0A8C9DQB1_PROSS